MPTIADIRQQYPQYNDMSDDQLAHALHGKFYSDMPYAEFAGKIGIQAAPAAAKPTQDAPKGPTIERVLGSYAPLYHAGTGIKQAWDAYAQMLERLTGHRGDVEKVMEKPTDNSAGATLARGAGQALVTAPLAAVRGAGILTNALQGATVGGATGVMEPVYENVPNEEFWAKKAEQLGGGMAAGGIAGGGIATLGRMFAPKTSPAVGTLMKEGVYPSPGQVLGGTAGGLEESFKRAPLIGDVIQSSRGRAVDQLNRAMYNRALAPIGQEYPKNGPVGREGVAKVAETLSDAYETLLPQMRAVKDAPFDVSIAQLRAMVQTMPEQQVKHFEAVLQTHVLSEFTPGGLMSGETLKKVESQLGSIVRNYMGSGDPAQREFASAVRQLQANVRDMVTRSNPALAPRLQAINKGYATLTQIENAGSSTAAAEGFTPGGLLQAVKNADKSPRKRAFASGRALNQDLADAARSVLSDQTPETGARMIPAALTAAGLHATGLLPYVGVAGLAYTPLGQRMAAGLFATRTPQMIAAGQKMGAFAPYLAAPAAAYSFLGP